MAISCEINLFRPPNAPFKPGETIVGAIKYAIDKPMKFDVIIVSLKGSGNLTIEVYRTRGWTDRYTANADYVNVSNMVTGANNEVPAGCYITKFKFALPENIPTNLYYQYDGFANELKCKIEYYIEIKFSRPGLFTFSKVFKKRINISPIIIPQLSMEPKLYKASTKLTRLFSRKNAVVEIKATITNSVVPTGGKIQVNLEIKNDTNVIIRCVEATLIEVYNFKASGYHRVSRSKKVDNVMARTDGIDSDTKKLCAVVIDVPSSRNTLQHTNYVTREYFIRLTAKLPVLHSDLVLDIPVEIGVILGNNISEHSAQCLADSLHYDNPPSEYWAEMA